MLIDYYDIMGEVSDEEQLVQRTVRSFVEGEVLPIISDCFAREIFPAHLIPKVAELGAFGAYLPKYGAGLSRLAYGLICQEMERGDSALRSLVSVQTSLCMYPIDSFGSEDQKEKWLPKMAAGEVIGCFGLTEPDHGSDPSAMETRAVKDGEQWVLNGSKAWITNGGLADIAIIWAQTDQGIRGFLVEGDAPGFSTTDIRNKLSLRASVTSNIFLDECRIPLDNILHGTQGLKSALSCLNEARFGIAWGAVGAAMACLETALEYSSSRIQFGKPIAAFQLTQAKLADMLTEITKAQLLCLRLSTLKDESRATPAQISLAKRNNVHMALEIARSARSILGANGIGSDLPVFRHMVNLESLYTYEGTHEIHTLTLGRDLTGIAAFA